METHANVIAVQDALDAAGAGSARVVVLDDAVHTAAAAALGVEVGQIGHPKPVRTLVDTALAQYEVIWAAGGVPRAVFPTTYAELVRITAGTPVEVS